MDYTQPKLPLPPFTQDSAVEKVQLAEDSWNTLNPEVVANAYTHDTIWRNRSSFLRGREEVIEFLKDKWQREHNYRLRKNLWAFSDNRIAVRFRYEWMDSENQWWRSYGNEMWEFTPTGLMSRREASINDVKISATDLEVTPGKGELSSW